MSRTATKILVTVGVLGVLAGVAFAWKPWEASASEGALQFESVAVDKGRIAAKVTATGTLSPRNTVQVGAQISGRISELHADFNSRVTKGQVVAKLDTRVLESQLAGAKANLAAATANLAEARAQARNADIIARRHRALRKENINSQQELDDALSAASAAHASVQARQAQVTQAEAAIEQAEVNISYATIVSPVDGVVLSRSVEVGQTVAASLSAPTLYTIAEDLARMQIDTSVAEGDVGKIASDMKATFTVDAFPGRSFDGKVRQVRNSPTTVSGVVTYNAVIDVDNPDLVLKPGMTANVVFVVAEIKEAIRIPNAALRFRPDQTLRQALFAQSGMEGRGGGRRAGAGGPGGPGAGGPGAGGPGGGGGGGGGWGGGEGGEGRDPNARLVWKIDPATGKAVPVRIKVGLTDGTNTALESGDLKEGDKIVTEVLNPPKADRPQRLF